MCQKRKIIWGYIKTKKSLHSLKQKNNFAELKRYRRDTEYRYIKIQE